MMASSQRESSTDSTVPSMELNTPISLQQLRSDLIRQEETIIFALIERAQFPLNPTVYRPGCTLITSAATQQKPLSSCSSSSLSSSVSSTSLCDRAATSFTASAAKGRSFLDIFLQETEKLHALVRRYTCPSEHPFFPEDLPMPVLPLLNYKSPLRPNRININAEIMRAYIDRILPMLLGSDTRTDGTKKDSCDNSSVTPPSQSLCDAYDDATTFGSCATADIAVLQALSKRIHYGKYVAEVKYRSQTELFSKLIADNDANGIMKAITDESVEDKVVDRVRIKAEAYGQDPSCSDRDYKVAPTVIAEIYRKFMMPFTKDVQVQYLLQRQQTTGEIGFLGPEGSFTHQAALRLCAKNKSAPARFRPYSSIPEAIMAVLSCDVTHSLVPLSNSKAGIVAATRDVLFETEANVCGQISMPVEMCLLSQQRDLSAITKVASHPHALAQCKEFLDHYLSNASVVETSSTSRAAQMAAEASPDEGFAAISAEAASSVYRVPIIRHSIQDGAAAHTTRFILISRYYNQTPSGKDRTLLRLSVLDKFGALSGALSAFANNEVNLCDLISHPTLPSGGDHSVFLVEVHGHPQDENMQKAFEELKGVASATVLGAFLA